jgi:hypothetical protein
MEEVKSKREKDSKTFKISGEYHQKKVYDTTVHCQTDNGDWNEISSEHTVEDGAVQFTNLHNNISIDLESYCGELQISAESFTITTNITPVYEDNADLSNEMMSVSEEGNECVASQHPGNGIEHRYHVTDDGRIKIESEITKKESLPDQFAFVITYDGVTAEYSDTTRTIKKGKITHRRRE